MIYQKILNGIINGLLQVHIATESSKFGFSIQEIEDALISSLEYSNVNIIGLMGMATFTSDEKKIKDDLNESIKRKISRPKG